MAMEKQRKLVALLLDRTRRGELDWSESIQDASYQVSLSANSVRIHAALSDFGEDEMDYSISLINNEGKTVDRFTDVEAAQDLTTKEEKQEFYRAMGELYDLARRTALGSEKILNEILGDLDDGVPF